MWPPHTGEPQWRLASEAPLPAASASAARGALRAASECAVCLERGAGEVDCCSARIHRACLARCRGICPCCRSAATTRALLRWASDGTAATRSSLRAACDELSERERVAAIGLLLYARMHALGELPNIEPPAAAEAARACAPQGV